MLPASMLLPFDRDRLRERNAIDLAQEIEEARRRSTPERFEQTLELSELVRALAEATGVEVPDDLAEKARLYAEPLRVATRRR
jgi:hypothetical protein